MVYYKFIDDKTDKRSIQHKSGFSLLQKLMYDEFGYEINESDITSESNGKPCFVRYKDIHFNISHCDGLCSVIVIKNNSCGIDCERIRPFKENVCGRIFSDREKIFFDSIPPDEKEMFFFILWTLKESYGKFTGKGIADMKNVSFFFENGKLISSRPELEFRVYRKDDYILSTCYKKTVPDLQNTDCTFGIRIY